MVLPRFAPGVELVGFACLYPQQAYLSIYFIPSVAVDNLTAINISKMAHHEFSGFWKVKYLSLTRSSCHLRICWHVSSSPANSYIDVLAYLNAISP